MIMEMRKVEFVKKKQAKYDYILKTNNFGF